MLKHFIFMYYFIFICTFIFLDLVKESTGEKFLNETFVSLNNISLFVCSSSFSSNNEKPSASNVSYKSGVMVEFSNTINYKTKSHNCPFLNMSSFNYCPMQVNFNNISSIYDTCKIDNFKENTLNETNFDKDGYLLSSTEFNKQYSFEIEKSKGSSNTIILSLDFLKHNQSGKTNLNSPRLEIIRENKTGIPDMSSAKNQEIIWTGNIKNYFRNDLNNFTETYITLQFNTGRHGNRDNDTVSIIEKRGLGVLFDVSNKSNPNLLEYRDDNKYTKYDYEDIKQYAGNDFVFYSLNKNGSPNFINDLINKDNVEIKVKTFITKDNKRVVETFVDNGTGKVIPYWIIKDISKLKDHDGILDKTGFINTTKQGSGYVIVRTDNIDTRPISFKSLINN